MAGSIVDRLEQGKLRFLVEQQGTLLFASDRPGLLPLRDAVFEHGRLLDGADVAVPACGLGCAYLMLFAKAGRVFARVMSREAHRALAEEGIEHAAGQVLERLPEEHRAAHEPLDVRARAAVTPLAFVEDVRRLTE